MITPSDDAFPDAVETFTITASLPIKNDGDNNIYLDQITGISNDTSLALNSSSLLPTQRAVKTYVDTTSVLGLYFVSPVNNFYDPTSGLPVNPDEGDRYICSASANGWLINRIYTYSNTTWTSLVSNEGLTCYNKNDNTVYSFNGSTWIRMNLDYTATTNSTSTNTGALVMAGGVGIAKDINIGGILTLNNVNIGTPESYNGVGDGLTDDSDAIQNCINSCQYVMFGAGRNYRITKTITIPNNRIIDLNGSTIMNNNGLSTSTTLQYWLNETTGEYLNQSNLINGMFYINGRGVSGKYGITIKNGTLLQAPIGIRLVDCRDIVIENIKTSCVGQAMQIQCYGLGAQNGISDMQNITIKNCRFENARSGCIGVNAMSLNYYISNLRVDNCVLWNWGSNGISMYGVKNSLFSNITQTYDQTYTTWPVSQDAQTGELSKKWMTQAGFSYTDPSANTHVNQYMYLYWLSNFEFNNCIFFSSWEDTSIKLCQGFSDVAWVNCKIRGLYLPLPNTYDSNSYTTSSSFIDCSIGNIQLGAYCPSAVWSLQFTRCTIQHVQFSCPLQVSSNGSFKFNSCVFKVDPTFTTAINDEFDFRINDGMSGEIDFDNCDFYPSSATASVLRLSLKPSVIDQFSGLSIAMNNCRFNGSDTAYYGLDITNVLNTYTTVLKSFIIDNCDFKNCKGIMNYNCTNLVVKNSSLDNGIIDNGILTGTGDTLLIDNNITTPSNRYYLPSSVGMSKITNHNKFIGGDETIQGILNISSSLPSSTTWYATFRDDIEANYSASGITTGTTGGTYQINNGFLRLVNSSSTLNYPITSSIDNGGILTVKINVIPLYSGNPSGHNYGLISLGGNGYVNLISLYHTTAGALWLWIGGASNIIDANLGTWSQTQGTEYEFEINIDLVNGATRVFIDGTQFGSTKTNTGTRTNATVLYIGSSAYERHHFLYRNVLISSSVLHTSNYTAGSILPSNQLSLKVDGIAQISNATVSNGNIIANSVLLSDASTINNYLTMGKSITLSTIPANATWYATYANSTSANYSLNSTYAPSFTQNMSISNGILQSSGTTSMVKYTTNSSVDGGQQFAIRLLYKPTTLTGNTEVFTLNSSGNNYVRFYLNNGVNPIINVYSSTNTLLVSGTFANNWTWVAGTTYELEINVDLINSATRFFINGVQWGSTLTGTGTRTASTFLQIGNNTGTASMGYSKVIMFNTIQHTANYTPTLITDTLVETPILTDPYNSTSYSTGALIVHGGIGVSKNVNIGSTTISSSTTTGALTVAGGVGIKENLYVGGTINGNFGSVNIGSLSLFNSNTNYTGLTIHNDSLGTNRKFYLAEAGVDNAWVGGGGGKFCIYEEKNNMCPLSIDPISKTVHLNYTTVSTNTLAGSLIVSGGVAIEGNLNMSGNLNVGGNITTTGSSESLSYSSLGAIVGGTINITASKFGKTATLNFPYFTGTATSSLYYYFTGLNSGYLPSTNLLMPIIVQSNTGVGQVGSVSIGTNGSVVFYSDANSGNFTDGNAIGHYGFSVSYVFA